MSKKWEPTMRKLWTAREVAALLSVKPATIYSWVKARQIPYLVLSNGDRKNCVRFRQTEIERWLQRKERKPQTGSV